MIELTQQAGSVLLQSLQASGVGADMGMRLVEQGDRLTLQLDSPTPSDHVLKHEDAMVLIIGQGIEAKFGDAVIDVAEGPGGNQLVIRQKEA